MSKQNIPVEEYTTPDPVTADENESAQALLKIMNKHGIRHLPITRNGAVVGIISERDLRVINGLNQLEKAMIKASDIMIQNPLTVDASTQLEDVAFLMSEQKVGSVIVNEKDEFLGIFTVTDALNALIEINRSLAEA